MLVFTEHGTRRLHLAGVAARPAGAWTVRQARDLGTDLGVRLGRLRFGDSRSRPGLHHRVREVFRSGGLKIITILPGTPRMNAICERVIGIFRRELLSRALIPGGRHLDLVLRGYVTRYDRHRPHQSRQQRPPGIATRPVRDISSLRSVRRKPVVTGLINEYHHAA